MAFEEPISKAFLEHGVMGVPTLISDPTILRVLNETDTIVGRLCAAELHMSFKHTGSRY